MNPSSSIKIVSIQTGMPRTLSADTGREWTTAFYKDPVAGPVRVMQTHLEGDGQADLRVHGGPDKAINAYCSEHYPYWMESLSLQNFPFGAFGENLTLAGALETDVCIGDIYETAGPDSVALQISQPRQPCWKLSRRWNIKDLSAQVERNGKTGWYFRVLRRGTLLAGAVLGLSDRPHPEWTIARANEVMHHLKEDCGIAIELAACPALSGSWKDSLSRRAGGT